MSPLATLGAVLNTAASLKGVLPLFSSPEAVKKEKDIQPDVSISERFRDPMATMFEIGFLHDREAGTKFILDDYHIKSQSDTLTTKVIRTMWGYHKNAFMKLRVQITKALQWYQPKENPLVQRIFLRTIAGLYQLKNTYPGEDGAALRECIDKEIQAIRKAIYEGIPQAKIKDPFFKEIKRSWTYEKIKQANDLLGIAEHNARERDKISNPTGSAGKRDSAELSSPRGLAEASPQENPQSRSVALAQPTATLRERGSMPGITNPGSQSALVGSMLSGDVLPSPSSPLSPQSESGGALSSPSKLPSLSIGTMVSVSVPVNAPQKSGQGTIQSGSQAKSAPAKTPTLISPPAKRTVTALTSVGVPAKHSESMSAMSSPISASDSVRASSEVEKKSVSASRRLSSDDEADEKEMEASRKLGEGELRVWSEEHELPEDVRGIPKISEEDIMMIYKQILDPQINLIHRLTQKRIDQLSSFEDY